MILSNDTNHCSEPYVKNPGTSMDLSWGLPR